MHGPAFDDSGKIVEMERPASDVRAYQDAGWKIGGIPKEGKAAVETPASETSADEPEVKEATSKRGRKGGK